MVKNKLVKLSADASLVSRILDYKLDTSDYDPKSISAVERKKYMIYDYINNNMDWEQIKKKYCISNKTEIDYLKSLVKVYGYEVFNVTSNEKKYSKESKLKMVNEVIKNGKSMRSVSIENKLLNQSVLRTWVNAYKKGVNLSKKRKDINYPEMFNLIEQGEPYSNISKKYGLAIPKIKYYYGLYAKHGLEVFDEIDVFKIYSEKEKEEIVAYYKANEKDAIKTAIHFKMRNVMTLYSWVRGIKKEKVNNRWYEENYKKDLELATDIFNGNTDKDKLAEIHQKAKPQIKYAIRLVKHWGLEPFLLENRKKRISDEKKKELIKELKEGKEKIIEIGIKYKIVSLSTLYSLTKKIKNLTN